jgi:fructokinase
MRLGIDLGGTKIEILALAEDGTVRSRRRVPTPAEDYDAIVHAVVDLVGAVETELGHQGTLGIGVPGAISPATGRMKNANTVVLNGRPLQQDLERALARSVRLENDANCFALSEAVDGAAAGAPVVFGAILGTGVGGGIVVHGRPLLGPNAIAGEWGHNPLPWPDPTERPGPACYCGKTGCVETFLSGPGLAAEYERRGGPRIAAREVVAAAEQGDPTAEATLRCYEDRLARALASVINVLDPDVVVLGGGLSNIERLYDTLPSLLRAYVFSDAIATAVRRAQHGDSSGVRGAAWLGGSVG